MRSIATHLTILILGGLFAATSAHAAPNLDYDLRANAPLAHIYRDGVVADASKKGFVKYIRDMKRRWKLGQDIGGRRAALIPGLQANLWLPVGPELASESLVLEALIKPFGEGQALDPFVNGKKAGHTNIEPNKWQIIRIKLDAGLIKNGINKVRLHFRKATEKAGIKTAAAIRFVRIVKASAAKGPVAEGDVAGALKAAEGQKLVLPDGAGLDYYLTPVKGLTLTGKAEGGTVEVWAQTDGGSPKRIGGGKSLDISLNKYAGKAVRLMLRGKGGHVKLSGAKLTGAVAGKPTIKKPKYVVFWLVDTLRADKLKFYGTPNPNGRKVKTPNLAKFAKESTVFDPYWVQGNESKASHASLFTGTYPVKHGAYTHKAKLKTSLTTIAEAFKSAGYFTGGLVSNGYISKKWNYNQGFKSFTNTIRENKANSAKALYRMARKWIDKHKASPFYLYIGTSDPHVSYRAHKEFLGDYWTGDYSGGYKKSLTGGELGKIKQAKNPPSKTDKKRIEALYDNEVAFNDFYFGKLVEHLKTTGIYDETMIIVSSDHGDEFWEHGSCGHGHSLKQELINVPLMVRWPATFPKGTVSSGSEGVDVLPTLLKIIGGTQPKDVQGTNLLPYLGAKRIYPKAIMASMGTSSFALAVGPAKVIMRSESSIKVYNTKKDPGEKKNVYKRRPVLALSALDPLSMYLTQPKSWRKDRHGLPNNLSKGFK